MNKGVFRNQFIYSVGRTILNNKVVFNLIFFSMSLYFFSSPILAGIRHGTIYSVPRSTLYNLYHRVCHIYHRVVILIVSDADDQVRKQLYL